jgi:hypothetical protein
MADPFDSPKSLINHTKEDFSDLVTICKTAFQNGGYAHIIDREPETGHKRYKIKFTGSIPSRARYVANNILINLRHALDQALVASIETITRTKAGRVYFPIANSPADLKGRLRNIPEALHPILTSFEPYPRGSGYVGGNDFLCAVTKVVGPNKHQITLSPSLDMGPGFGIDTLRETGKVFKMNLPPVWDMANGEMILATVADDCDLHYDFKVAFQIAFGDAGPMFRQPVIPVLHKFTAIVERIILALEAETRRIGLIDPPRVGVP